VKMKKFEGRTEQEAIEKVKAELGPNALVVNIKKTQPRGVFAILRKPLVEITAAYEEQPLADLPQRSAELVRAAETSAIINMAAEDNATGDTADFSDAQAEASEGKTFDAALKEITIADQQRQIAQLESRLSESSSMMQQLQNRLRVTAHTVTGARRYANNAIQIFYDMLIANDVTSEIAGAMLDEFCEIEENDEIELTFIVKVVYNMIIEAIGTPAPLNYFPAGRGDARVIAFIGSTGVGKTTTIAKLAASMILESGLNVAFVTADTYRIAAVEQLKTYADILGVEVGVAYSPEDAAESVHALSVINDVVLIDTAGRSPKNVAAMEELTQYVNIVPSCEKYLVLSLTTKWQDLLEIIHAYDHFGEFNLIFTKLDETSSIGAILNICRMTGRKASYITCGQNVPDDIRPIRPEEIARALLGLGDKPNGSSQ